MPTQKNPINPTIFREYDIRGIVGEDLSPQFARLLGRAYGSIAREKGREEIKIAVGHDSRLTSQEYAREICQGLNEAGVDALFLGIGPTPQLYYAVYSQNLAGGIQITGSHNPPNMNGFKLLFGTHTLSGEEIQQLRLRMEALADKPLLHPAGKTAELSVRQEYIDYLIQNSKPHMGARRLKIVVDAGNGVGGLVGPAVLSGLGCEVIELFCEPDGRFPNHHPDPTVAENLPALIEQVRTSGADFGIGWDGDADRIAVVDEQGEQIFGDMLLLIFSRAILRAVPGATIVGDVKCSNRLFDDIQKNGGNALMWKSGHSLVKGKVKESGAALGGEMSGHVFFAHRFFGFDDALHASARLAEIASSTHLPFSALLKDLPPSFCTPELRIECAEDLKFKIPLILKEALREFPINDLDGIRISFPHGWALIRASNTQPILVVRFEAESAELLSEYQRIVSQHLGKFISIPLSEGKTATAHS